ncbi:MAG: hypothetical protein AB2693_13410, partial [Candidatus Thiodiazotropha sp.]
NNCQLDIRQGLLSFENQTIQCTLESQMPTIFKIAVQETIEIPASSEMVTCGIFSENLPHFSTAMVEEYQHHLSEKGILLAHAVIDTNHKTIPLRLINLNSFPTKLYKNETAAICDPVTILPEPTANEPQAMPGPTEKVRYITPQNIDNTPIPEHMQEMYENCTSDLSPDESREVKQLLLKHTSVFSKSKSDLGNTGIIQHRINTGLPPPLYDYPHAVYQ